MSNPAKTKRRPARLGDKVLVSGISLGVPPQNILGTIIFYERGDTFKTGYYKKLALVDFGFAAYYVNLNDTRNVRVYVCRPDKCNWCRIRFRCFTERIDETAKSR